MWTVAEGVILAVVLLICFAWVVGLAHGWVQARPSSAERQKQRDWDRYFREWQRAKRAGK